MIKSYIKTIISIIPYIIYLIYKSNKTILMFYGTFNDEGDNPMNNPSIYNVERNNRLSPGLQQVVTLSTTLANRKFVENAVFFSPVS